jgi:hypothetical protein
MENRYECVCRHCMTVIDQSPAPLQPMIRICPVCGSIENITREIPKRHGVTALCRA